MAFAAIGALWAFYGVTLLGVLTQLQDPGPLLQWSPAARGGVLLALVAFLVINLLAIVCMTELFMTMARRFADLPNYLVLRWGLIVLHLAIDCGVAWAASGALELCTRAAAA